MFLRAATPQQNPPVSNNFNLKPSPLAAAGKAFGRALKARVAYILLWPMVFRSSHRVEDCQACDQGLTSGILWYLHSNPTVLKRGHVLDPHDELSRVRDHESIRPPEGCLRLQREMRPQKTINMLGSARFVHNRSRFQNPHPEMSMCVIILK